MPYNFTAVWNLNTNKWIKKQAKSSQNTTAECTQHTPETLPEVLGPEEYMTPS